jgi:hypothetical protein
VPRISEASAFTDKDCSDFRTQRRAQRFFKRHNPRRDRHRLDGDNDGIACESNRCPCKGKASASREVPVATPLARKQCHTIKLRGVDRVFFRQRMKCRTAKTYARRIARTEGDSKPKDFKCHTSGGWNSDGSCEHKFNSRRFFLWYPEH